MFNVNFTAWKWVVSALFGFLPLVLLLGFFTIALFVIPAWKLVHDGYKDALTPEPAPPPKSNIASRAREWVAGNWRREKVEVEVKRDDVELEPPPAYEPEPVKADVKVDSGDVVEERRSNVATASGSASDRASGSAVADGKKE